MASLVRLTRDCHPRSNTTSRSAVRSIIWRERTRGRHVTPEHGRRPRPITQDHVPRQVRGARRGSGRTQHGPFSPFSTKTHPALAWLSPALISGHGIGHPQGGAVVSEASNRIQQEVTTVTGVVVIDVVEGVQRNAPVAGSAPRAREVTLRGADIS